MGGDEHTGASFEISENGVENVVAGGWVDATKRLVENVEFGFTTHDEGEL